MKELIHRMHSNPKNERVFSWIKLIAVTGSAQVIVQVLGFISGIMIIRMLPTQEYAFYTLANTMLGTMTILADGGIGTGVMAQGGKVWQNRKSSVQYYLPAWILGKNLQLQALLLLSRF